MSLYESGSYIILKILDCEKKNININDSFIFKIFDKSIINNKNILDCCNNEYAYKIIEKLLDIIYNENISAYNGNNSLKFKKVIFDNLEKLSFNKRDSILVQIILEYEKKNINEYSALFLILEKLIIEDKQKLNYYRSNEYASLVVEKLMNILYNENKIKHYGNIILDLAHGQR